MTVPLFAPRRAQTVPGSGDSVGSPAKKARGGGTRTGEAEGATSARHTYAREAAALVLLASALYTSLALASFQGDPLRPEIVGPDWVGPVGAAFAGFAASTVGIVSWSLPLELALLSGPLLGGKPHRASVTRFGGDIVVVVILAALAHVAFPRATAFGAMPFGGSVGELFGEVMRSLFSAIGSYIIGLTIVSLILVQRATFSFIELVQRARRAMEAAGEKGAFGLRALLDAWRKAREIERETAKEEPKELVADAKIVAHSPTDAIIAALTEDVSTVAKGKDATPDSMSVVLAKGASEPAMPIPWTEGDAIASAFVETDAAPKPQRKRRAASPKPIALPSGDADAKASIADEPAKEIAKEIAKEPVKEIVKEPKGPSIIAPPADPAPVMIVSDMAAGDAFVDAVAEPSSDVMFQMDEPTSPEPRANVKERAARSIEPRAPRAPRARVAEPKAPPTPSPAPPEPVAMEEEEEEENDDLREDDLVSPAAMGSIAAAASIDEEEEEEEEAESPPAPPKVRALVEEPKREVLPPAPVARAPERPKDAGIVKVVPAVGKGFRLPTTDMLEPPSLADRFAINEEQLRENAALLEKTLSDYGVNGKVEEIHPGPTVTTFEVAPAAGTKVSKVASLADDLALGLSRKVRIIAPIPGKNRIGFELPNERRIPVCLRELVEDRRFQEMKAPLPCVLGRDIVGAPYFADLASMPHVIVAGATGAGKSVGLNVMLVSLLFRKTPDELRLLMIDPKVVELAPFDRIPHMLLPVVTDMKQAANALKWAVDEMERRYQLFANAGTKNIGTYNAWVEKVERGEARPPKPPKKVAAISAEGLEVEVDAAKDGSDVAMPEKIPYIVIVVDEFADLMMQQGKDVEASVARLAQKARAAGMHVILATQRPSVDVITGMIKANFPTRIAFRVAQKVDSRTILDEQGAEHLLGRGDMLVKMNGATETRRVQCPFASEEEVQRITDFLRLQGEPVYDEAILKPRDEDGQEADANDAESDPMYDAAVRIVAETRRCSTSWIQRKLGVGYNRAAKIVECMEKRGIVGPANGAKDREVLIAPL